MSTHGFRFGFQDRTKTRGGFGDFLGGTLPGLIGDVVGGIFGNGEPDRPMLLPGDLTQLPGDPTFNGGTSRTSKKVCVAPGFSQGQPCCPSGMHFSESAGCCVKNRRMNFQNGRAFNRAVRRVAGKARADKRGRTAIASAAREMGVFPKARRPQKGCDPCK